ncbi:Uncharacterised protein [uncultured archaeon]|nr:Uncharacterised protein [uncultured archaeon]
MSGLRAQGSSEYLLLLSAVLVVALVAVTLISEIFPQAGGLSNYQYQSYWRAAQPFAIADAAQTGTSSITVVLQNNAAHELDVNSVSLTPASGGITVTNSSLLIFTAGQRRAVVIPGSASLPSCSGSARSVLYTVSINYDDEELTGKIQGGSLPLPADCQ